MAQDRRQVLNRPSIITMTAAHNSYSACFVSLVHSLQAPITTGIPNPRPTRAEIDSLVSDLLSPGGGHSSASSGVASPIPNTTFPHTGNTAGKTSSIGGGRLSFGRRSSQGSHSGGQITSSDLDNFPSTLPPASEPKDAGSVTGAYVSTLSC